MGAVPDELKRALDDYVAAVRREIPVEAAYLFGSRAHGSAREDSDVDLAIVSESFRGMRRVDVTAMLFERTSGLGLDLQPIGLLPEDLLDDDNPIARAVREEGVEIGAV